ncbi:hypothetical protein WJX79_009914 [Trebouxia sp. C0005]
MVVFLLQIKASLENVAKISLPEGHEYCIDVKNSTGEDQREGVRVTSTHEQDLPGSRGVANFALKWVKDAKSAASLNVVSIKKVTREYTAQDERQFVSIIGFECRGMDVINWHPEDGFRVESTSGQLFDNVDLSDGEWVDYDEKLGDLGHARFSRRKHRPGSGGITYTHNQKHRLQDKGVWYSCKAEVDITYMNASEPELVKSFVDADALSSWLVDHDVDLTGYGRGQAKSVQQLWREVEDGETVFSVSGKAVTRCIDTLLVYIISSSNKVLQEEFQIMPNGTKRARDVPLAEKMKAGEAWKDAVIRAVKEELGSVLSLAPQVFIKESSYTVTVEHACSQSYPNLQCKYTVHKVEATVNGLPETERFVTIEQRPDGTMENHWVWTSSIANG